MNNAVFGKTMENVRKHRDIKLVTTDKRRNQLVSEPNYHTTKYFSENLIAIEMKRTNIKIKINWSILVCQYKTLAKHLCMNFGKIKLNQSTKIEQNYAMWILAALLFILKLKIFMKTLLMTLEDGLTHQTTAKMIIDRF